MKMANEEWRAVPNIPYEISNRGRFRRTEWSKQNPTCRPQKPEIDKDGYVVYTIIDPNDPKRKRRQKLKAHRLVCEAWHGPPPIDDAVIRHLDGTKDNNVPDNICWGTSKENSADRDLHGTTSRGETSWRSKMSQEFVDDLRQEFDKIKQQTLAKNQRTMNEWVKNRSNELGIPRGTYYNTIVYKKGYKK